MPARASTKPRATAFVSIDKILRRGIICFTPPIDRQRAIVKSTSTSTILATDLPGFELHGRGKVRDVYRVDDRLLIIATDRISAFDYVLPTGIPDKGRVLTQLSIFWFDFLRDLTPTHFLTAAVEEYPEPLRAYADQLEGRSMLVKRADMI